MPNTAIAEQPFYNFMPKSREEEQNTFVRHLYHDARNGEVVRLQLLNGEVKEWFSSRDIQELPCTGTYGDTYLSLNTFRSRKRTEENLFNRSVMYIDLDAHENKNGIPYTEKEIAIRKKNTIKVLEKAWNQKEISLPTMINDTGRGLGLFLVLKNSISAKGNTTKLMQLFQCTYDSLLERYKEVLERSGLDTLHVDFSVRDAERIARLPGTLNTKTGTCCQLISVNYKEDGSPLYYDLSEIINGSGLELPKKELHKPISFAAHVNPFLQMRVRRLQDLQAMRGSDCVGKCREVMCFIMYAALSQIYEPQIAANKLEDFNENFTVPLPFKEISRIVKEVDGHLVSSGKHAGTTGYPISDRAVIRMLAITDDEIKRIGFGKSWKRQQQKEKNKARRDARNQSIADEIAGNPEKTYERIAEQFGVSVKTVERIAKTYNVSRYHNARKVQEAEKIVDTVEVIPFPVVEPDQAGEECVIRFQNNQSIFFDGKTDKKCNDSFYVYKKENDTELLFSPLASAGWGLFPSLRARLLASLAPYRDLLPDLDVKVRDWLDKQQGVYASLQSDPYQLMCAVSETCRQLAIFLSDARTELNEAELRTDMQVRKKPKRHKKQSLKKRPFTDQRFEILSSASEFKHLNPDVLAMVMRAVTQMRFVQRESFLVNGREVSVKELKSCYDSLSCEDIATFVEHLAQICPDPDVPFYYVMTSIWRMQHPDDTDTAGTDPTFSL